MAIEEMQVRTVPYMIIIGCALLSGCKGKKDSGPKAGGAAGDTGDTGSTEILDADGDGVTVADGDCDDADANRYPGRVEDCDGIDNNCNDVIDEGFGDGDDDGTADCMDVEECDGVDNDGDGEIDEGFDEDGDGLPDCESPEICDGEDNDGDGLIDEDFDLDGDGFTTCGSTLVEPDCDDSRETTFPGAVEIGSDLIDNDCDGLIDEGAWAPGDLVVTEIMNNPQSVRDTQGEWVEIVNQSERTVVLNGLQIVSDADDGHFITAPDALLMGPGARFVLGNNDDPFENGGVEVGYRYRDVSLSNESDTFALVADGVMLDSVAWDDGLTMPDPMGSSLLVDPDFEDGLSNDLPESWCTATEAWGEGMDRGSPGQANEYCPQFDHDGDGWTGLDGDCDDADPDTHPEAIEIVAGVDNDCDGEPGAIPVAAADYDPGASSLALCETVQLDGGDSYDPDGGTLSYLWSLDSTPEGSGATTDWIVSSTDERPTFDPDLSGLYDFSLVVDDGLLSSLASRLTIDIRSPTPVTVDAGTDYFHGETVTCSEDPFAPGEYDCPPCAPLVHSFTGSTGGGVIDYGWSWLVEGTYVIVSGDDTYTPTATITGLAATAGETRSASVTFTMWATDCAGVETTGSMVISLECTGTIP